MPSSFVRDPLLTGRTDTGTQVSRFHATGTATAVGTLTLPSSASSSRAFNEFTISGLTGETIAVSVSSDGTNFSAALIPDSVTTGLRAAAATLGNGTYRLPKHLVYQKIKFVKSSTVETVFVSATVLTAPNP